MTNKTKTKSEEFVLIVDGEPVKFTCDDTRFTDEMKPLEFNYIRKKLGLSQKQLAALLSLSVSTVQAYEQGINPIQGLVAKIMRMIHDDSAFYKKFASIVGFPVKADEIQRQGAMNKIYESMQKHIEMLSGDVHHIKNYVIA
jgi:DNA-binding transcriptional regulator YiaG